MPITVATCCGFVTDMRSAVTMIILLAIVTNPIVSWILVRHTYAIRAACLINLDDENPDVLGISLTNFLSFGFAGSTGLGPSCLVQVEPLNMTGQNVTWPPPPLDDDMVRTAKYFGWIILVADIFFLLASVYFFVMVFKESDRTAAGMFAWGAAITLLMCFIYGMMYVHICIKIGHAFPLFEFIFCIFDMLLWIYFVIVVISYRQTDAC